jgi:hypothetical protein
MNWHAAFIEHGAKALAGAISKPASVTLLLLGVRKFHPCGYKPGIDLDETLLDLPDLLQARGAQRTRFVAVLLDPPNGLTFLLNRVEHRPKGTLGASMLDVGS